MGSTKLMKICLVLLTLTNCITHLWAQSENSVDAGILGRIQGNVSLTIGRSPRPYLQFLGIPYASKPTRFMVSL
jgi:hypothetical protein